MHFQGGADGTAGLTDSGQRGCEVREGKQDEAEVSNRKAWAQGEQVWEQVGNWEVSRSQTSPGPPGELAGSRMRSQARSMRLPAVVCAVGPNWAAESTWLLAHCGL